MAKKNLKGTWAQALSTFLFPIVLILGLRWAVFEPYVIPSASMVPNLLIHDHILVLKSSLGLRMPFTKSWLVKWGEPKRGDVLVFRYPENPHVFYIKRLIGLPGDKIEVNNGRITVNDQPWSLTAEPTRDGEESFDYYLENSHHLVRFYAGSEEGEGPTEYQVPEDAFFFMGDNRDQSSDSREWGFVPRDHLIGHAWLIWLSCEETLESASYICDFSKLRPQRMLKWVQ